MFKAYASGGKGGRVIASSTNNQRTNPISTTTRTRGRMTSTNNQFNYDGNVQYTSSGYPIVSNKTKSGYSYYMNGVQINSKSKLSMKQVDDYFSTRDRNTDLRYI